MDRIIVHIDMDAFFAAVEERERSRLKGMPIVVGADPKGGVGRGVVSTANYKAREYGIRSALPISTAWRLSEEAAKKGKPRVVFLEPNFRLYSAVSQEIMEYLRTKADAFEPASIDEVYIEKSKFKDQNAKWEEAEELAREIKKHIKETQLLTCSIGIGPNKLVAKIAAGRQKPDGLIIVKPEEVQDFLDPLSAREIPGIGPKSEEALLKIGVRTIQDLRKLSQVRLEEMFGRWGTEMWRKAQGIDESPVMEEYETKSIGEQETFDVDTLDSNLLIAKLRAIAESVFKTAVRDGFMFRTISIVVRFHDFETKTRAHTLLKPVQDLKILETEALQLFLLFLDARENPRHKRIRLLGVRIEKLEEIK
ncbi:MAG TPA: DNA polymerase IV [Candidatus Paceibacterota bacterium]